MPTGVSYEEGRLRKKAYFKHILSTDLVVEPIRIIYLKDGMKVKANLYTTGYGNLLLQDTAEWFISKEDLVNWKPFNLA